MSITDNPCKECVAPKRYPGCHAVCEAYGKWKEEWDAFKKEVRRQQDLERLGHPQKPIRIRKKK